MSTITIRLAADKLVPLRELAAATAAAVQPDATEHKIVERGRPIGHFSRQGEVRQAHERQLLTMIAAGTVIARSLLSRAPWATVEWLDGDADKCGLTFDDARVFCRSLMIDVQPLEVPVTAKPATEPSQAPKPAAQHDNSWKELARQTARSIYQQRKKIGTTPNLLIVADEVADIFRKDGVRGPKGAPLTGASIKRHALQGHDMTSAADRLRSTLIARGK